MVENSEVKLELLCVVGLRVSDASVFAAEREDTREMRKNSVFSELPTPPVKWR